MRQEVKAGGEVIGYVELVRPGEIWKAVAYGMPPYPPPLFGQKGDALAYVKEYGKTEGLR